MWLLYTVSYVTWDEWDTIDDDSLVEASDADGPNMDEFYQRVVSSDNEDFVDSDDGSVADLDRDISDEEDYCDSDYGSIQWTEQPADHKCRAGCRPAGDRIPEETDRHGDSWWDIPRKRALSTSDGTDSMTFGSNTPESHADRPPDVVYSERLITEKRQGEGGTEKPCSSHIQLEMAVSQLQRDED